MGVASSATIQLPAEFGRRRAHFLHLLSVGAVLFLGTLVAVAARMGVIAGKRGLIESGLYDRAMTLHAIVMVFLGLIPGIPFALGRLLSPVLLSREFCIARSWIWTSLCSYWAGAVLIVASVTMGRLDTGLCYVVAYSSGHSKAVIGVTCGVFLVGLACAIHGFGFVAAAQRFYSRHRDNGLSALAILVCMSVIAQVLVLPIQGCTLALMLAERFGTAKVFDVSRGGDPLLLRHLFWFYVQPAVMASILPAIGVVSHILDRHAVQGRRHDPPIIHSALVLTILGFTTWGIHLIGTGQSPLMSALFSAVSLVLLVPMSVPFPIWFAHLRRGFPEDRAALIFALGTMILLAFGAFAGLAMSMLGVNAVLSGTYFEVGHLHFIGGAVGTMALLGGMHCAGSTLAPGRPQTWRTVAAALLFLSGLLTTFVMQLIMGSQSPLPIHYGNSQRFRGLIRLSDSGVAAAMLGLVLVMLDWAYTNRKRQSIPGIRTTNPIVGDL
jgi:cytochrome c oxidase subunit 1